MGHSSKAPKQPKTTTNMGLFGSTTTSASGSKWKPTAFQSQFVNNAQDLITNAQNALLNPSLSEARINDLNRTTNLNFQNNMLNPALSKGLLRGSTAQDIYSVAQQNYANNYQAALDAETQRQYQAISQALGNYMNIYDLAKGVTGLSNSLNQANSNYALQAAQLNQNANNAMYGMISNGIGTAGNLGSAAILASDKRLKRDIKKLDEVGGYNIYEFRYKGDNVRQVGVIAQEVEKLCPKAVLMAGDGYYRVDYAKLPKEVQERIEELK